MLRTHLRVNKIQYAIALLLMIFYTINAQVNLLAAVNGGTFALRFHEFNWIVSSSQLISIKEYLVFSFFHLLVSTLILVKLIQYRFNDSDLNGGGRVVSYIAGGLVIFFCGIYFYRVVSTGLDSVTFEFALYFWMLLRVVGISFLFILLKHIPLTLKYGVSDNGYELDGYRYSYSELLPQRKKDESIVMYLGCDNFLSKLIQNYSIKMRNISGRLNRSEYIAMNAIFVVLVSILNLLIDTTDLSRCIGDIWHSYISYVVLIWYIIANISMGIRRLHDSGSSGLWLVGIIIPYINLYVIYLIIVKPSISQIESISRSY